MATARAHSTIENALHWQLDVSFREDAASNRKDNQPASIAVLPRRALHIARREPSNASLSMQLQSRLDDGFLCSMLTSLVVE